jgi:hypothetical protein
MTREITDIECYKSNRSKRRMWRIFPLLAVMCFGLPNFGSAQEYKNTGILNSINASPDTFKWCFDTKGCKDCKIRSVRFLEAYRAVNSQTVIIGRVNYSVSNIWGSKRYDVAWVTLLYDEGDRWICESSYIR